MDFGFVFGCYYTTATKVAVRQAAGALVFLSLEGWGRGSCLVSRGSGEVVEAVNGTIGRGGDAGSVPLLGGAVGVCVCV